MNRLRVAQVMEATIGGTRRHLFDLVTHVDRSRFDVSVICSNLRESDFNADIEHFRSLGISVHIIPMVREISPAEDYRALRQLARHFTEHEYDVIHAHSSKAGALTRWAARVSRATTKAWLVYTPHVFPFLMQVPPPKRWLYFQIEKASSFLTHHWIAVSDTDYRAAIESGICGLDRITRIPNGIDPRRFDGRLSREEARHRLAVEQDAFVVGSVGRLTRQKGQAYLLHAAPSILRDIPQAQFLIIGEGEDRPALEKTVSNLKLTDHVVLPGRQVGMETLYPAMNVFVLSSLWEGCPYTLLEAMYSQVPAVASDIPGNRDIIRHGETGLLAPPANPAAIRDAVVNLYHDPELAMQLAERACQEVTQNYTVDQMVQRTQEVYTGR